MLILLLAVLIITYVPLLSTWHLPSSRCPMNKELRIPVQGEGLYDVTSQVAAAIKEAGAANGLATLFIQHTSASLLIQENADSSASRFTKLVKSPGTGK